MCFLICQTLELINDMCLHILCSTPHMGDELQSATSSFRVHADNMMELMGSMSIIASRCVMGKLTLHSLPYATFSLSRDIRRAHRLTKVREQDWPKQGSKVEPVSFVCMLARMVPFNERCWSIWHYKRQLLVVSLQPLGAPRPGCTPTVQGQQSSSLRLYLLIAPKLNPKL